MEIVLIPRRATLRLFELSGLPGQLTATPSDVSLCTCSCFKKIMETLLEVTNKTLDEANVDMWFKARKEVSKRSEQHS